MRCLEWNAGDLGVYSVRICGSGYTDFSEVLEGDLFTLFCWTCVKDWDTRRALNTRLLFLFVYLVIWGIGCRWWNQKKERKRERDRGVYNRSVVYNEMRFVTIAWFFLSGLR